MYSILIKDSKNAGLYRFLTVKQEIMKEETQEVTDPDTQEVKTETISVGTGGVHHGNVFYRIKR